MVRISAIFIAVCMMLIAGSLGFVLYLRFGFTGAESGLVALAALTALAVYNTIAARKRDRAEVSDQVASLARGASDTARQVAEFGRRLGAAEGKVESVLDRALATAQPLAAEIEEMSRLVRQLADSVAAHDAILARQGGHEGGHEAPQMPSGSTAFAPPASAAPAAAGPRKVVAFDGLERDAIIAMVGSAIEAQRIDLYLQPIVTLPQRKVRYYEAMSRLKAGNGEIIAAVDFMPYAEAGSQLPKLDSLSVLRCVQIVRRLLLKNREIGLFCNLAGATLTDSSFPQLLEFIDANRAIAPSLVFEFSQSAVRAMGPIEHESLAAMAERGFRFSMDNLTDLRIEPRELTERGFRFVKVPAQFLLNRVGVASTDIHPADFSDLLGRFGIDLVADRIEAESTVVDLLDYDVRFGQGFLFSPPRPVRADALQAPPGDAEKTEPAKLDKAAPADAAGAGASAGALAQLARAGAGRQ